MARQKLLSAELGKYFSRGQFATTPKYQGDDTSTVPTKPTGDRSIGEDVESEETVPRSAVPSSIPVSFQRGMWPWDRTFNLIGTIFTVLIVLVGVGWFFLRNPRRHPRSPIISR